MSFIDVNLGEDVKEAKMLPEGTYPLVIEGVDQKESKASGAPMLMITLAFAEHPDAMPIFHYVVFPLAEDEDKTRNFKLLNLKRFLTLFGVAFEDSGFNEEDLFGQQASCAVGVSEPDDNGNTRNELRVPRLASE